MLYSSSDLAESEHFLFVEVVLAWFVASRIEAQLFAAFKKFNVRNGFMPANNEKFWK